MITENETKIVIRILKEELMKSLKLMETEKNETMKESLKEDAIACQKRIKLFSIIGE